MRESGILVDIHPEADHKRVLIEESGSWGEIGLVERSRSFFPDITSSEKVLARTIESGLFKPITRTTYERIDYVESTADWATYITCPRTEGYSGDAVEISKALARLDAGEECLRVHTKFNVATYARL